MTLHVHDRPTSGGRALQFNLVFSDINNPKIMIISVRDESFKRNVSKFGLPKSQI
jgi:hypothetical protein